MSYAEYLNKKAGQDRNSKNLEKILEANRKNVKILVGIPTFDKVSPECFQSIYRMKVPNGCEVDIRYITGYGPAIARNKIANIVFLFSHVLRFKSISAVTKIILIG